MRVAICDDQVEYLQQNAVAVRKYLQGEDVLVDVFKDGNALLKAFTKRAYDVVFLDIEMPEIDGITAARKLRQLSSEVYIIFLTSHIEFALEGYEVNALRYLTKPIDPTKLREVLKFVVDKMRQQRALWIKTDLFEGKVQIKDILYMESQNQNVLICTEKESYSVRYNLGDYEKELAQDGFFRVHRGYLVSLAHIKSVGKGEVLLDDNTSLPVSRAKERELKDVLFQYIRREAF